METEKLLVYTKEELAMRDGVQMPEIWTAYNGLIYDVTTSRLFKKGKHFKHPSGQDLTDDLEKAPHTARVFDKLKVVGMLKDG